MPSTLTTRLTDRERMFYLDGFSAGQPAPRPRGFLADMPRTAPAGGNARSRRARRNGWNRTA